MFHIIGSIVRADILHLSITIHIKIQSSKDTLHDC